MGVGSSARSPNQRKRIEIAAETESIVKMNELKVVTEPTERNLEGSDASGGYINSTLFSPLMLAVSTDIESVCPITQPTESDSAQKPEPEALAAETVMEPPFEIFEPHSVTAATDLLTSPESLGMEIEGSDSSSSSSQGSQHRKRIRTDFNDEQLQSMRSSFAINQNPGAMELDQLYQDTGLSVRIIKKWFKNEKYRRNKSRIEGSVSSGEDGVSINELSPEVEMTENIDVEVPLDESGSRSTSSSPLTIDTEPEATIPAEPEPPISESPKNDPPRLFPDPAFEIFETGDWICNSCATMFSASEPVGRHLFTCLSLEPVLTQFQESLASQSHTCHICSRSFPSSMSLLIHSCLKVDSGTAACTYCARDFGTPILLRRHESQCTARNRSMDQDEEVKVNCPKCRKVLQSKGALQAHLKAAHEVRLHECKYCSATFAGLRFLTLHTRIAHRKFECGICSMSFNCRSNLILHVKKHRSSKKRVMPCNFCAQLFIGRASLAKHVKEAHPDETKKPELSCTECPKSFLYPSELRKHLASHSGVRQYACSDCSATFMCKLQLQKHEQIHVPNEAQKPFHCKFCSASFPGLRLLSSHTRYVHKTKELLCKKCDKSFTFKANLLCHLRSHAQPKVNTNQDLQFQCGKCPEVFPSLNLLKLHGRTHAVLLQTKCTLCSKTFLGPASGIRLKVHLRTHTGERPFSCSLCPARFRQSCHLKVHSKVHNQVPGSREGTNKCRICQATFGTLRGLKLHITVLHEVSRAHKCDQCPASFTRRHHLSLHRARKHKSKTKVTGKALKLRSRRNASLSLHCAVCRKKCRSTQALKAHSIIHTGERPYKCDQCPADFNNSGNLSRHRINIHNSSHPSKSRLLRCKQCNARFKSKGSLRAHMRFVHKVDFGGTQPPKMSPEAATLTSKKLDPPSQNTDNPDGTTVETQNQDGSVVGRPHVCSVCNQKFKQVTKLRIHLMLKHKSEFRKTVSAKCKYCRQVFTQSAIRTHHCKKRPFTCSVCSAGFNSKCSLRKHEHRHVDLAGKPHRCSACKLGFRTEIAFKGHMARVHNKYAKLSVSKLDTVPPADPEGAEGQDQKDVKQKESKRSPNGSKFLWHCTFCSKDFPNKARRRHHCENMPYKCSTCQLGFRLEVSMIAHRVRIHGRHSKEDSSGQLDTVPDKVQSQEQVEQKEVLSEPKGSPKGSFKRSLKGSPKGSFKISLKGSPKGSFKRSLKGSPKGSFKRSLKGSPKGSHKGSPNGSKFLWHCEFCSKDVPKNSRRFHHCENMPYKCSICKAGFLSQETLRQHTLNHNTETNEPHVCPQCNAGFNELLRLNTHMRRIHNLETIEEAPAISQSDLQAQPEPTQGKRAKFQCPYCSNIFNTENYLALHLKIHSGPLRCSTCQAGFSSSTCLLKHSSIHSRSSMMRRFKCKVCPSGFTSALGRVHHNNVYHGTPPSTPKLPTNPEPLKTPIINKFKCTVCPKSFPLKVSLVNHMRKHANSFQCTTCDARFKRYSSLMVHSRVHRVKAKALEGESVKVKPAPVQPSEELMPISPSMTAVGQCHLCPARYLTTSGFATHMKIHTKDKAHACPTCGATFDMARHLSRHISVHDKVAEANPSPPPKPRGRPPKALNKKPLMVCPSTSAKAEDGPSTKPKVSPSPSTNAKAEAGPSIEPKVSSSPSTKAKADDVPSAEPKVSPSPSTKAKADDVPSADPKVSPSPSTKPKAEAGPSTKAKVEAGPSTKAKVEACPSTKAKVEAGPSTKAKVEAGPSTKAKVEAGPSTKAKVEAGPSTKAKVEVGPSTKGGSTSEKAVCPLCSKVISNKGNLETHIRMIHTKEKVFKCHICKMRFGRHGQFWKHLLEHRSFKPLKCRFCWRKFIYKRKLDKHERKHDQWDSLSG